MTTQVADRASGERTNPWRSALAVTLLMQVAVSFLSQAMTVLGPSLTKAAGVAPELVGQLASIAALGTLWFLMGGALLLASLGPVRILQSGVLLGAAALVVPLSSYWPAIMVASLLVGFGYGPAPPAGNEILMRLAPAHHRSLIFSIKQSGAPLGAALAGFLLPFLAAEFGWRGALICAALLAAACVVIVEPFRMDIDRRRASMPIGSLSSFLSPVMILTPFRALGISKALQSLAYAGFTFAMVQGSVFALFVTFLSADLGFELTAAGIAFATMQIAGAVARVAIGWLSDRIGSALLTIAALGLGSSVMMGILALMGPAWPWWGVVLASAATGSLASSWNGVLMAEMASTAPQGRIGEVTSAATFFVFIGYVAGPAAFTAIIWLAGSYAQAFLLLALVPLSGSVLLYRSK